MLNLLYLTNTVTRIIFVFLKNFRFNGFFFVFVSNLISAYIVIVSNLTNKNKSIRNIQAGRVYEEVREYNNEDTFLKHTSI